MSKSTENSTPVARTTRQDGFALLLAVVVAVLLTLIGLTLTRSSLTEVQMSGDFEAHEKAQLIADAGFNIARNGLRGRDLSTVLATPTVMPRYLNYEEPAANSPAVRNPISVYEARNIDFRHAPTPIGVRTLFGSMTPPTGTPQGGGRFFASVSDNLDEGPLGLPNDPKLDSDYTIYLRVAGLHPGTNSEVNTVGTSAKNAICILEGLLRRDFSFDIASPLVVYGQEINANFSGNSFDLVGDATHPAVTTLYNAPSSGDASAAYQDMIAALGSKGRVVGEPGPDGISVQDGTQDIRDSNNPDATNVFDPVFMDRFMSYLEQVADRVYATDPHLSGSGIQMGTVSSPQITVAQDNLTLNGGGSGAGVLVVRGVFDLGGAFVYDGLVLVVGDGELRLHGANKTLRGGVYVANVEVDSDGNRSFGTPVVEVSGNSNFVFSSDDLKMAINLLPLKTLSLRELTPDLEP